MSEPATATTEPPLDLAEFWPLYDQFSQSDFKNTGLNNRLSHLAKQHLKQMFKLERPERGWKTIRAWIALENKQLYTPEGGLGPFIFTGDVVIIEYGYDRDIIVTHSPIQEFVSGPLLGLEQSHGLFLPLFDPEVIERAINIRLYEVRNATLEKLEEYKGYWARSA